ncbi:D-serine ammonia-lyase [Brevibacillus sp. HD3.3A]|uniref:D-serine ammonia-lyase n=1 Tax=Brevibacillus sp. HD3.3A TaxID=2738979 RepID=UPI00156B92A9|nr:D-serine ammonia-lyase [Brevibacillus sp. HD3.3A]UED71532.1 D-serine ammonia-lyase [Brevibacillus sp. HD3.3A]
MENGVRVEGKTIEQWKSEYPLLSELMATAEVFWTNPRLTPVAEAEMTVTAEEVQDAEERLRRFAPFIQQAFPETSSASGLIESPLASIPNMQDELARRFGQAIPGRLLLKCDSHLPIAGSIKARGGIYEVLAHAEELAKKYDRLPADGDYSVFATEEYRGFFSQYSIAVGSTGNLGLSIGIISAKLGFRVTVHMSADAKAWKKDLLRAKGVQVVEYQSDYGKAVEEGRKQAEADPQCYFIDDENSKRLFLGYAVAAGRLQKQLEEQQVIVDSEHPLFVYLPCGVGGGPGGVAYGLKLLYGDHVHCFFAEPTHSPCMLLGLMTGYHDKLAVQDFGIDNKTDADGLAVGRPSRFVGKVMEPLLSGVYTVADGELYRLLRALRDSESVRLEPSALAGMPGPIRLLAQAAGQQYIEQHGLADKMKNATHIAWATGGSMVPAHIQEAYYAKGLECEEQSHS